MIKISKDTLASSLVLVGGIVKRKTIIPVMGNIHITVKDEWLRFRMSDTETQVQYKFKIEGDDEMDFLVPAHLFISMAMKAVAPEIELELKKRDNGTMYINLKSGKGKFKMEVIESKDYIFNEFTPDYSISLTGDILFPAFKRAFIACDPKDRRPAVNGCAIANYDNYIHITGSHEAIMSCQVIDCSEPIEPLLLSDTFSSFISSLKYEGRVNVFRNDNWFGVKFENYVITTKVKSEPPLSQDRYFEGRRDENIMLNRLDFEGAIKRVSSFTRSDSSKIILNIHQDELVIEAIDGDLGHSGSESVDTTVTNVEPMKMGINYNYLLNCISSLESEYIYLYITAPNERIFVEGTGGEAKNQKWLLMPMRI